MTDAGLRRLALQIAAQLPPDANQAERCLLYAQELVASYLRPRNGPEMPQDRVLAFRPSGQAGKRLSEPVS